MKITESTLRKIVREEIIYENVRSGRMSRKVAKEIVMEGFFDKVKTFFSKKDPEDAKRMTNLVKVIGSIEKFYLTPGSEVSFEVVSVDKEKNAKVKATVDSLTFEPGPGGESSYNLKGPFTVGPFDVEKAVADGSDPKAANRLASTLVFASITPFVGFYQKKYPDTKKPLDAPVIMDNLRKAAPAGEGEMFKFTKRIFDSFSKAYKENAGG
jgi:hypothetical protein